MYRTWRCLLFPLFFVEIAFSQVVDFTSSNLPIIVINTHGQGIPDEPKIEAAMGIIYNGPGQRNNSTDPYNNYDGRIGIEIRGSSSQMFPKKQYSIELHDEFGNDNNASLLGMPAEEDWILFAPYNDKTLMRDVLAYKFAASLDRYAPRTRFCELVLNGTYQGVYVLLEKIKRDPNRVDISKLNLDEINGDDLTGGYIIKVDKSSGNSGAGWASHYLPSYGHGQQIVFQYEYPAYDEIVKEQKLYIQNFVSAFEETLASNNFMDPVSGYRKYINVGSFIDFFIINELSKNVDAYRLSTFLYKDKDSKDGRLHMGPVWDFNLGFGNADYCTGGAPTGFVLNFNSVCPNDSWLIPFWWGKLMKDVTFKNKLYDRWTSLRAGRFQTETILSYVDSVANVLNEEAQQRNFQCWPVLGEYVWPNYFVGQTFQEEVDWLKEWITDRLDWMDQNILYTVVTGEAEGPENFFVHADPNPFHNEIRFRYSVSAGGDISLHLIDAQGRSAMEIQVSKQSQSTNTLSIDTSGFSPGLYFYRFYSGSDVVSGKLVRR